MQRRYRLTLLADQFPQAVRALSELGFDALAAPVRSLLPLRAMLSDSVE